MSRRSAKLPATLESDGTLAGSRVWLNGVELENVAAIDLRIDVDGATLHVSIGRTVVDYGRPASVDVRDASGSLEPAPSPRD